MSRQHKILGVTVRHFVRKEIAVNEELRAAACEFIALEGNQTSLHGKRLQKAVCDLNKWLQRLDEGAEKRRNRQ